MNNDRIKLQKWYYISGIVIAIIAIAGVGLSIYSIRSNSNLYSMVKDITESTTTYMGGPIVKITGFNWIIAMDQKKISCKYPPIGCQIIIKNFSSTAVWIDNISSQFSWGREPISSPIYDKSGNHILGPGENDYDTIVSPDYFRKKLGQAKSINQPPHLNVITKIVYYPIKGIGKYEYEGKRTFPFDCKEPLASIKIDYDKIIKIK